MGGSAEEMFGKKRDNMKGRDKETNLGGWRQMEVVILDSTPSPETRKQMKR